MKEIHISFLQATSAELSIIFGQEVRQVTISYPSVDSIATYMSVWLKVKSETNRIWRRFGIIIDTGRKHFRHVCRNWTPLLVLIIALAFRIALFAGKDPATTIGADGTEYLAVASSLLKGDGFCLEDRIPSAKRTPLYPMFLAAILSFPRASFETVLFVQMIIDAFTPLILFLIARNLLGETYAIISGIMLSLYLPTAVLALSIQSETLFAFFLLLSLLPLTSPSKKLRYFGIVGILLATATLTRPNGLIFAFFIILWLLYRFDFKRSLSGIAIFLIAYTLLLSLWIIRNYRIFGHFIPTSTITGIALYNSYIIPEKGLGYNQIKWEDAEYFSSAGEVAKSRYLEQKTIEHIWAHPFETIKLIPLKIALLIYPFDLKWLWPAAPFRYNFFWGIVFNLTLMGILIQNMLQKHLSILVFSLSAMILTSIVFIGLPRYRMPFDPLFIIISSVGLRWMWQRFRRIRWISIFLIFHAAILLMSETIRFKVLLQYVKPW